MIDPLVDAVSGQQNVASRHMKKRLREIVREQFPAFEVRDFPRPTWRKTPSCWSAPSPASSSTTPPSGCRRPIASASRWPILAADKIVAKSVAAIRKVSTRRQRPICRHPVWVKDAAVDAYIKTCQGTKLGDPIDPVYRERIDAATLVSDAILAYEKRISAARWISMVAPCALLPAISSACTAALSRQLEARQAGGCRESVRPYRRQRHRQQQAGSSCCSSPARRISGPTNR